MTIDHLWSWAWVLLLFGPMISLETALTDARGALDDVDGEREELHRRLRELDAKAEDIRAEIRGLELALKRYQPAAVTSSDIPDPRWLALLRTDAIVRALNEEGPLSPGGLAGVLASHGREGDTPNLVSATLNDLRKRGRVRSLGQGRWVAVPPGGEGLPMDESTGGVTS